jgi:hypothetical protein
MPTTVTCMGFTQAELQSFRDASVPDLVGPGLKLLFVGINPGLWTPLRRRISPILATASIQRYDWLASLIGILTAANR